MENCVANIESETLGNIKRSMGELHTHIRIPPYTSAEIIDYEYLFRTRWCPVMSPNEILQNE